MIQIIKKSFQNQTTFILNYKEFLNESAKAKIAELKHSCSQSSFYH